MEENKILVVQRYISFFQKKDMNENSLTPPQQKLQNIELKLRFNAYISFYCVSSIDSRLNIKMRCPA